MADTGWSSSILGIYWALALPRVLGWIRLFHLAFPVAWLIYVVSTVRLGNIIVITEDGGRPMF